MDRTDVNARQVSNWIDMALRVMVILKILSIILS